MFLPLFIALLASTSPMLRAMDDFDTLMKQGRAAWENADIELASAKYQMACTAEKLKAYPPERVASCEHHLATISSARDNMPEAERHFLLAVESWKAAGPRALTLQAVSLMNLGELYRRFHRMDDAERALTQALEIVGKFEDQPGLMGETLSRIGFLYQETGRSVLALKTLREAVARFEESKTPSPTEQAYAINGLGMTELALGYQKDAEEHLEKAVQLSMTSQGPDHPETAGYQTNLALAFVLTGQFSRATPLLRRARQVTEARGGANSVQMGLILAEMSAIDSAQGKLSLAEEHAVQALRILSASKNANPAAVALAQVNLADVYLHGRRLEEANRILPDAVSVERRIAPDSRLLADGLRRLADLRALQHSWKEAQDLYGEAITIYERHLGPSNPVLAPALRGYAEALKREGGSKEAIRSLQARAKGAAFLQ